MDHNSVSSSRPFNLKEISILLNTVPLVCNIVKLFKFYAFFAKIHSEFHKNKLIEAIFYNKSEFSTHMSELTMAREKHFQIHAQHSTELEIN